MSGRSVAAASNRKMQMVSPQTMAGRHDRVRAAMAGSGYDVLVVAGNTEFNQKGYVRYLADWRLYGGTAYLVLSLTQDPIFLLGLGAQGEWARQMSAIADTRPVLDKVEATIAAVLESAPRVRRIGVAGLTSIMPYGEARRLMEGLTEAVVEDASDVIESTWGHLTTDDLVIVEESHQSMPRIFDAFSKAMRPGRRELDIVAEAYRVAIESGCMEGMIHLNHDDKSGTRPATGRIVRPDDIYKMYMEFVTPSGYLFELGGCFSFKAPPVAWQRKFDIVAAAISDAMAGVRPGMSAGALVDMIRRRYERENLAITGRRLWDFHGQGMHSLMRPYGLPNSSDVVEDSTMINIHPGILTEDGLGISATNNFIVTPDGGCALGGFRHVWHVL